MSGNNIKVCQLFESLVYGGVELTMAGGLSVCDFCQGHERAFGVILKLRADHPSFLPFRHTDHSQPSLVILFIIAMPQVPADEPPRSPTKLAGMYRRQ